VATTHEATSKGTAPPSANDNFRAEGVTDQLTGNLTHVGEVLNATGTFKTNVDSARHRLSSKYRA